MRNHWCCLITAMLLLKTSMVEADVLMLKDGRKVEGLFHEQTALGIVLLDPKTLEPMEPVRLGAIHQRIENAREPWLTAIKSLPLLPVERYFDGTDFLEKALEHPDEEVQRLAKIEINQREENREIWELGGLPYPYPQTSRLGLLEEFNTAVDTVNWERAFVCGRQLLALNEQVGSPFMMRLAEVCRNVKVDEQSRLSDATEEHSPVLFKDVRALMAEIYYTAIGDATSQDRDNQQRARVLGQLEQAICVRFKNFMGQEQKFRAEWRSHDFHRRRFGEVYSLLMVRAYLLEFKALAESDKEVDAKVLRNIRRMLVVDHWDKEWVGVPPEWNILIFAPSPTEYSQCYKTGFLETLRFMALEHEKVLFKEELSPLSMAPELVRAREHFKRLYIDAASQDLIPAYETADGEARARKQSRLGFLMQACADVAHSEGLPPTTASHAEMLYRYSRPNSRPAMALAWADDLQHSIFSPDKRTDAQTDLLLRGAQIYLASGAQGSHRNGGKPCQGATPATAEWAALAACAASRMPIGTVSGVEAVPFDTVLQTAGALADSAPADMARAQKTNFAFRIEPCLVAHVEGGGRGESVGEFTRLLCQERLLALDRPEETWRLLAAGARLRDGAMPGKGFDNPGPSHVALTAMDILNAMPEARGNAFDQFLGAYEDSRLAPGLGESPDAVGGLIRVYEAALRWRLLRDESPENIWATTQRLADAADGRGQWSPARAVAIAETRLSQSQPLWDRFFIKTFQATGNATTDDASETLDLMADELARRFRVWIESNSQVATGELKPPTRVQFPVGLLEAYPLLRRQKEDFESHQALARELDLFESTMSVRVLARVVDVALLKDDELKRELDAVEELQREIEEAFVRATKLNSPAMAERINERRAKEGLIQLIHELGEEAQRRRRNSE